MKYSPFMNALSAAVYIVLIAFVFRMMEVLPFPEKDTILAPMFILSLFVFSAAVMGVLFLLQPLRLYFDNRKKEAVDYFVKTLGFFAGFVVLFFISLLFTLPR